MKPVIIFNPWHTVPCMSSGHFVDRELISKWDGVTHQFLDDWHCELLLSKTEGYSITIKTGFITDGGSIPKMFRNIINPWGPLAPAFFIHDMLYATKYFKRSKCDKLLRKACHALGASWVRRNEIYAAVRTFGGLVWKQHDPEQVRVAKKLQIVSMY